MHLYLGKAKSSGAGPVTDQRFFLRCIIRHSDLVSNRASFEYMRDEGERVLLEAMDALEVSFLLHLFTVAAGRLPDRGLKIFFKGGILT